MFTRSSHHFWKQRGIRNIRNSALTARAAINYNLQPKSSSIKKNKSLFTQALLPDKEIIHLLKCLHIKLLICRICAFHNNQLIVEIKFIQHYLLTDDPIITHS